MNMMTHFRTNALIAACMMVIGNSAMAYTIDGQISDWGVTNTGNVSDWTPNSGIEYAVSDQNNNALSGGYVYNYTAPGSLGYGDQPYDAEAVYLDYDSTYLYYAVVTGRPEVTSQYPSGDIAFDFGSDGSFEYGVESRGNNGFSKGDLVQVSSWALGSAYPAGGVSEMQGGTVVSNEDFVYGSRINDIGAYTANADDDHYVLEGRIALSNFSLYSGQDFTIHWTMGCGNDEIHLASTLPNGGGEVPVPGTGLLLGSALIGWTLQARRKARKDQESEEAAEEA